MKQTPVVLIPALACTCEMYQEQTPALWKLGPVTFAQHAQASSMDAIAREILENAPSKFALAGLSMGGYIAFEIMRQAPQRVLKLALISTSARPDSPEQTKNRLEQIALAHSGKFNLVMQGALPFLFHRDDNPDALKVFLKMASEIGADGFERQQRAIMGRADSRPTLATIACPTLVLGGTNDRMTPPELLQEIANGIQGSVYREIADCGHAASQERPQAVTDALVEWLKA